ncbi:TraC-F-type conjugal transfer protein (plasmid) [Enterococcus faecalis]|uniref:VirB4-like conjugal transfer ATPase, CD1110 family n=1 Tax=Enterococcus faecalis TaxID=1351 RepID=UPI00292F43AC|nr:TraC-F-type conjugal transfer protein [Enterococcus faecalis]WOA50541.1 TraC-F-type conjugal transfer protein [Enterococcus faecalis]
MNLFKKKQSKKQTLSSNVEKVDKKVKKRVQQQANPTVQESIFYTSQFEEGLMHIVEDEFSKCYKLGEVDYEIAVEEDQLNTVMGYAEGLNTLDKNSRYQLLVVNKREEESLMEDVLLAYQGDHLDNYRQEINEIITKQYEQDERNFKIEKYAIFTTKSSSMKQANKELEGIMQNFANRFEANQIKLEVTPMTGLERLSLFSYFLRHGQYFGTSYQDIAVSGLTSKAFIVPSKIKFPNNKAYFRLGENYAAVLTIQQYPKYLEDKLIKELCATGRELAISIHARPYDMMEARKAIQGTKTLNDVAIQKQQKQNFRSGVSEDAISGEAKEIQETTNALMDEIKNNGQKLFNGLFSVFLIAETEKELLEAVESVKNVGATWQVVFDTVDNYKEEAFNTILPIGKPYLDVEMSYMRDLTTTNIATQVPFTNVELQSSTGQFYGRNQLTKNMITIDRKKDLITPSGLIFGTSGSGKGMATKWEILSTRLKFPKDRFLIVDPESEYLPIGKELDAEILDISTGTKNHLNILGMVDKQLLDEEDQELDLVKEKSNLLSTMFESLLKSYTDVDAGLVDRVTLLTYERFENKETEPTLVDWFRILKEQTDEGAKELANKVETYCVGSQDIFAHQTNIDLTAPFIVFNTKKLDDRLKKFAMKVILDQLWKQVVSGQGKVTSRLYFDELQVNFTTEEEAEWFLNLWARIRKYGAVTTGITQNPTTLLDSKAGQKMIANSEFLILLRQKPIDSQRLVEILSLTPALKKYINDRAPQGTGLISAGGVVVPFENPIPKETHLFEIMNTDA